MANIFEKLFGKKQTTTADAYCLKISDLENCLLQQTTTYRRDCPIILATNDENELFLIYYFPNTFYIVKVAYENNKLNVVYDYRRKNPVFENFQYSFHADGIAASLALRGIHVDFTVTPTLRYSGSGCTVISDQTPLYQQFAGYIDTYCKHINDAGAMVHEDTSYLDMLNAAHKISDEDKKNIYALLEEGNVPEAIRRIQRATGLGLLDCKKISENPHMYL